MSKISKHKNFLMVASMAIAISSPIIAAVFYAIIRVCNHMNDKRYKKEELFAETVARKVTKDD